MQDLQKILVPIDGSPYSYRALDHAITWARAFDATLVLLHVLEDQMFIGSLLDPDEIAEGLPVRRRLEQVETAATGEGEDVRDMVQRQLAVARNVLRSAARDIPAEIGREMYVIIGNPRECIVQAASELRPDLIVMGPRGLSGLKGLLIGSASKYVLHHADTPVLLAR